MNLVDNQPNKGDILLLLWTVRAGLRCRVNLRNDHKTVGSISELVDSNNDLLHGMPV